MPSERSDAARQPVEPISIEGLGTYAVCHRQWRLLEQEGREETATTRAAQRIIAQRERISAWLALIGGGLIGLALLILVIGLLLR